MQQTRDIMNRKAKLLIAATILAGLGATAMATTSMAEQRGHGFGRGDSGGGHHGHGMRGGGRHGGQHFFRMLEKHDANGDGKLTQAEIDETRAARHTEFDKDGDGNLTLAEYEALWLDAMRERMVDRFQKHDADGDGTVTQQEFGRHSANVVMRMDRNDDGVLDKNDRRRHGKGRRMGRDSDKQ